MKITFTIYGKDWLSIAKFSSQGTIDISIEYNLALIENNIVEIENKEKIQNYCYLF